MFRKLFNRKAVVSAETGFVIPDNKILFRRALKQYLIWMMLTALATGAAEFVAFIVAMFYFNFNGNFGTSWLSLNFNLVIFWAIIAVPIIASIAIHIWMYRRIQYDDSRLGWKHCLIFQAISLLTAAPTVYFCYALFYIS